VTSVCLSCRSENDDAALSCFNCGQPLALTLRKGSVVAGRYEVQEPLGRGGMGMVYRAHDRLLDETVAIKVLRPDVARDAEMARRFQSEIKLARKVSHRNVCRIHEYGEDQGLRYISMEFLEGVDLRRVLRERGGLGRDEAYAVALQVADGLEAIHDVGVIHRDLKTPNIMRDARGNVRLMDFGIAKEWGKGGTLTATGLVVGTPEYMSPEQARGEKIDFRSDIYALGIVVFEFFTGSVPFRADTPPATILKQLQEPPPLDGPEAAGLPEAVKPVLRRALAKDPKGRFASIAEMSAALRAARSAPDEASPIATGTFATTLPDGTYGTPLRVPAASPERAHASVPTIAAAATAVPLVPKTLHGAAPSRAARGLPALAWVAVGGGGLGLVLLVGGFVVWRALPAADAPPPPAARTGGESRDPSVAASPVAASPVVSSPGNQPVEARPEAQTTSPTAGTRTAPPATEAASTTPSTTRATLPAASAPAATLPSNGTPPTNAPPAASPPPASSLPAIDPAVERLMADLLEPARDTRWRAAEALGNLGPEARPAVATLLPLLQDRQEVVRWRTAEALGKIGADSPAVVEALAGALREKEGLLPTEAAKALGKIGPGAGAAAPALADALRSNDVYVRREVAKALARMGPSARAALPALVDGLRDKDKVVRMEAARALGKLGSEARMAMSALTAAARDSDDLVARAAAQALEQIRGAGGS
jgi:serine/threonine-protein kinase